MRAARNPGRSSSAHGEPHRRLVAPSIRQVLHHIGDAQGGPVHVAVAGDPALTAPAVLKCIRNASKLINDLLACAGVMSSRSCD
jgi:hypothetical protein